MTFNIVILSIKTMVTFIYLTINNMRFLILFELFTKKFLFFFLEKERSKKRRNKKNEGDLVNIFSL